MSGLDEPQPTSPESSTAVSTPLRPATSAATRWLWMGGPLEPTPEMAAWLHHENAVWWLEPDLLGQRGCTLMLRAGRGVEPVRILPGQTFAYEGRRFQVVDPDHPEIEPAPMAEQAASVATRDDDDDDDDDTFLDSVEQACIQFKPEQDFERPGGGHGYLRFTDADGNRVQILPSHVAMRHCLRVYIEPPVEDTVPRPTPSGIVHPAVRPASMLLCRGMVRELRDALDRMLDEPVAAELACEHTIYPPDGTTYVTESKQGGDWRARCACGRVLSGGDHVQGPVYFTGGGMQVSIALAAFDPSNHEAIEHFAVCEPHLNQPVDRCTITGVLR